MRLTKTVTTAVVTVALGTGAALGIAQAGGDDPAPLWQPVATPAAVPATEAQKTAYSVLDQAAFGPTSDNAQVEAFATASQLGVDVDGAREVGSSAAGPIWLIPVTDGLCLGLESSVDTSLGTACEDSDTVIARGTTIGDGAAIYGIVPDGVTAITVTPAGGSPGVVTVTSGGTYTLPYANATVSVDGPNGVTEFTVAG